MQEACQIFDRSVSQTGIFMERLGLDDGDGRWRPAHRRIKQVAPCADASVDANGLAVQPQEHANSVAKG